MQNKYRPIGVFDSGLGGLTVVKELLAHLPQEDIVFFGEQPLYMEEIQDALQHCKEFVYIGTSSVVYPAAGFKSFAKSFGAKVTCLNLEVPTSDPYTDIFVQGKATEIVPKWCEEFK